MMQSTSYLRRREAIETYFDRTALDAWKRLTGDQKVSGVRATVRAGRENMRNSLLSWLPEDLGGWRILDAGCGSGIMALKLAERGADVLGVDLSHEMIAHAKEVLPVKSVPGRLELLAGDMLAPEYGAFDAVVSMDALIHYPEVDAIAAVKNFAERTRRSLLFTVAPKTLPLTAMLAIGRLMPRSDRSPNIFPANASRIVSAMTANVSGGGWKQGRSERITSGFYKSQAVEVLRS